ncbi:MAG: substrate-binding domain-containing protein [Actinobacteria bacterium]|nr:substrate-binding domain-containing protein [Actinomycetota bacterium]
MVVLALAAILVVAGCGGGSSSSSSATESSEPAETSEETGGEEEGGEEEGGEESGGETSAAVTAALESATYLSEGETGGGIRPQGGAEQEKAEKAGTEAGEEKEAAKVPEAKIGIINFLNGIESSDRLADSTTFAAAQLGWKSTVCDGKGTPSQFVACGNSLLAEGVNAIVEIAIEPGQITPVLQKARSKGIPVVQVGGGGVPLGELNGNYGPNEAKAGQLLTEALFEKLETVEEEPVEIDVHNFPAKWGTERTEQLEKAVEGQSKIKISDEVVTDAANLVPFTRNTVTTQITQNPNVKAYWFTFDTTGQVGGQVIQSKFPGKEFPEKPLVATFHGDLATLGLIESGAIDMESDVNYDAAVWMGIDGIAQELAREESMSTENQPKYPTIGDPFTYQIVTKENLPEAGQYVMPKWDVPSYFIAKWKAEYGV